MTHQGQWQVAGSAPEVLRARARAGCVWGMGSNTCGARSSPPRRARARCRLRIGQRDFFGRLAATAAAARSATIPVSITTLLITAGGIEDREVLSNRTGCFLRLRPGDWLVTDPP